VKIAEYGTWTAEEYWSFINLKFAESDVCVCRGNWNNKATELSYQGHLKSIYL